MLLTSTLPPVYEVSVWISASLAVWLASIAWQRRESPGAVPLFIRLVATTWFLFSYVVPLPSGAIPEGVGLPYVRFHLLLLAFVFIPPAFLGLVLEFTGRVKRWAWWAVALLLIEPALVWSCVLGLSPGAQFFGEWRGLPGDGPFKGSPLFWGHTVYSYSIVLAGVVMLGRQYVREAGIYRTQIGILMLAVMPPIISAAVVIAGLTPIIYVGGGTPIRLDFTPQAFFVSDAIVAYALFKHGYMDIVPVARKVVIDQMNDGILVLDKRGRLMDINRAAKQILGISGEPPAGLPAAPLSSLPLPALDAGREQEGMPQTVTIKDRYIDLRVTTLDRFAPSLNSRLVTLRDITETKKTSDALEAANRQLQQNLAEILRMQTLLREQALKDPLTGLYNRHTMEDALVRELAASQRSGQPLAAVMIDIDHFKRINDTYGYLSGDEMLRALGTLLLSQSREEDFACRYGGEEFLVVLRNASAAVACERANEWRVLFEGMRFHFRDAEVSATFSAGVAVFPDHSTDRTSLLDAADTALYAAKTAGRNRVACAKPLASPREPELQGIET